MIARFADLCWRMLRFRVAVTMWTFMVLGISMHATPTLSRNLVLATIALAASYVTATTLNDMADVEIDRINRPTDPGRPLIAGSATITDLRRVHGAAAGVAVVAGIPLGVRGLAIVGSSLLVSYAYSAGPIRLSRRMTLAPLALALAYAVIPYWLGLVVADATLNRRDAVLVAGLFVLFVARIVLKDFRDRLGDSAVGKPTLLLRWGKRTTCAISIAGAAVGWLIVVVAVSPPWPVASLLLVFLVGIEWMLVRITRTDGPRDEQIAIGLAARAGNGFLISIIAWLLLVAEGANVGTATVGVAVLVAVFAAAVVGPARHPERIRIGYKA